MGNKCTTCNSCGKYDTVEYVLGGFYLEDFQNLSVSHSNLVRHDLFYRVVCHPLHQLKATDFFWELDQLVDQCAIKNVASYQNDHLLIAGKKYIFTENMLHGDNLPLELCLDHFKEKDLWKEALDQEKGAIFKKLLQLTYLFMRTKNN